MKIVIPKDNFFINPDKKFRGRKDITLLKKNVYILPEDTLKAIGYVCKLQGMEINNIAKIYDLNDIIAPYDFKKDRRDLIPIIIRSGGIGDLIALSSVTHFLKPISRKIWFVCDNRFNEVFPWFHFQPDRIFDHFDPICKFSSFGVLSDLRYINIELESKTQNWYEQFYKIMNVDFNPRLGIPRLKKIGSFKSNKEILIVNRSSSLIRSMYLIDIVSAIKLSGKFKDYNISIYRQNLLPNDSLLLKKLPDIEIKDFMPISEYLKSLVAADIVISVDTAAIHFREGIGRKALGLYASFTTESRTKYYIHTHSIDIKSDCELLPCFQHDRKKDDRCPKMKMIDFSPPCLEPDNIEWQIINGLKKLNNE